MNTPSSILFFAAGTALWAGDIQLSGTIVDEFAKPVVGATVSFQGLAGSAVVTGATGSFTVTGDSKDVAVKSHVRTPAPRVSLLTGTVEWAGADAATTMDVFALDGKTIGRDLSFTDGKARIPAHSTLSLLVRIKRNGVPVSSWSGAGSGAYRSLAGATGILEITKSGFLRDTMFADALTKSGLTKTLIASEPWIPAGTVVRSGTQVKIVASGKTFAMGSNLVWDEFDVPESPRHSVKFTGDFWMDSVETTQALYDSLMKSAHPDYTASIDWNHEFGLGPKFPAYGVTAGGAILYCNARSKKEGLDTVYSYTTRDGANSHASLGGVKTDLTKSGYRLPTEAEWEYAARAGTETDFVWGSMSATLTAEATASLTAQAVWRANSFDLGSGVEGYGTHPVASNSPNPYGLYDMQGNLSEWCWDMLTDEGYAVGQAVDPVKFPDESTPTADAYLVKRGGHWGNDANYLRASSRTFDPKVYFSYNEGFRTVRKAQ
ncbi:MAG: SUMF1/EgtB/PvdO family nonheme iron enzyme [Fibrobacterota bacterium]